MIVKRLSALLCFPSLKSPEGAAPTSELSFVAHDSIMTHHTYCACKQHKKLRVNTLNTAALVVGSSKIWMSAATVSAALLSLLQATTCNQAF